MEKNQKVLLGIILVILVALIGIGIWFLNTRNKSKTTEKPKFNLSINTWVGFGPFYLAKEKGFFNDEGIDVNITVMEDAAQRKAAMINGSIDGLGDTVDLLVLSRDEGVPSVSVVQIDESNGADGILVTNNINSIKDIKGKKIAAQKNFVGESFLLYVLKKNGMSPNDVEIIDTESGIAGSAFVSGQVDAAVTFEPWLSKAKERKDGKVLLSSADEPGVIVDTLSINESYLAKNPENVKKVVRAWFKSLDYWQSHQEESNEIMAKYYNISAQEFADFILGVKWPSLQENIQYFGDKDGEGKIFDVADVFSNVFLELGSIKSKPDMTKAIDKSIINQL